MRSIYVGEWCKSTTKQILGQPIASHCSLHLIDSAQINVSTSNVISTLDAIKRDGNFFARQKDGLRTDIFRESRFSLIISGPQKLVNEKWSKLGAFFETAASNPTLKFRENHTICSAVPNCRTLVRDALHSLGITISTESVAKNAGMLAPRILTAPERR
jgi:hypothetical protein